ncbi:MAG: DUF1684 domain-containing protein [Leucobacter sp.]
MSEAAPGGAETEEPAAMFAEEWREWQRERWELVSAPLGQAALALTFWLTDEPRAVPGLTGLWRAEGGSIVGTGLGEGEYRRPDGEPVIGEPVISESGIGESGIGESGIGEIATSEAGAGEPGAGEAVIGEPGTERTARGPAIGDGPRASAELRSGERAIRRLERDGKIALRIFDPAAPGRTGLRGIEAYPPDPAWCLGARFDPETAEREIELFDGYTAHRITSGSVVFELDGVERRLTGTLGPDGIAVVFGDATNGDESYGFRFVAVPPPDADGATTIDFNRAYLPPCSFSDQFVCPLPTPENRLPVPIRAGERLVRRASASRDHVEL